MVKAERGEKRQNSPRRMAQFTLDCLRERKQQLEEELRSLGGTVDGQQRAALHDDPSTEGRKNEIRATLALIGNLNGIEVFEPRKETNMIGIGNQVSLLWEGDKVPETFLLLGPDDKSFASNEFSRIISYESPVGAAVSGKKVGDTVVYTLPGHQEVNVRIVAIEPGDF